MQKSPIVFIFNIRRSIYDAFGTTQFNIIKQKYKQINFLPIINNLNDGIQRRASQIQKKLPLLMKKLKSQKVNLISYSLSGIDTRFALSQLNLGQYCNTLTTIATPHKGSKSARYSERSFFTDVQIQPITRLMGVGIKPFHQFVPQNIEAFNQVATNCENVSYFSIGAERLPNNCNSSLRETGNYLRLNTQKNFVYQNDGIFGFDEIEWGNHLINFDADHAQIVEIAGKSQSIQTFKLIQENLNSLQSQRRESVQ